MKRKIIYTLSFILCMSLYASSKEYTATGKKGDCKEQAKALLVMQQTAEEEIADLSPIAHFYLDI
jgi:hypothetical protein